MYFYPKAATPGRSTFAVNPDRTLRLCQYDVAADGHVSALREELGV